MGRVRVNVLEKEVPVTVTVFPACKLKPCNATYWQAPTELTVNLNVDELLLTTREKSGSWRLESAPLKILPEFKEIELAAMTFDLLIIIIYAHHFQPF